MSAASFPKIVPSPASNIGLVMASRYNECLTVSFDTPGQLTRVCQESKDAA
jgi:hypothetical protein